MENPKPLAAKDPNVVKPMSKLRAPTASKLRPPSALKQPSSIKIPSAIKAPSVSSKNAGKRPLVTSDKQSGNGNQAKRPRLGVAPGTKSSTAAPSRTTAASHQRGVKKPAPTSRTTTSRTATTRATNNHAANGRRGVVGKPAAAKKATSAPAPSATAKPGKAKRPTWDIKGRLEDMEKMMQSRNQENGALEYKMNLNQERLKQLEQLNDRLKGTVAQKEEQTTEASENIRQLRRQLEDAQDELSTSGRRYQQQIDDAEHRLTTLQRKHNSLEGDLEASTQECRGLKTTVAQLTSAQAGLKAQLSVVELNLEQSLQEGRAKDAEIARMKGVIAEHEKSIEEKESKIREDEGVRRKLHNTIQELKGNIRVFCRVRPLLGDEAAHGETIQHLLFPDDDQKVLEMEKLADGGLNETVGASRKNGSKYEFQFDKVFDPESKQQDVFEEISMLVQSSLDGYNVCIFAYGQTGSGKTYTMEGPDDPDDVTMGMIPRAVEQVFETAQQLQSKGWEYDMEANFVEIYNETIRDLLASPNSNVKHEIKMVDAKSSEVMVSNLTRPTVTSQEQVASLLKTASHHRAVAATNCNERSSRSHSVFRLKLKGLNRLTGESCQGTLNLVDLAGSERLNSSGSTGERLRETKCINKSLSNLGNVIMALGNKESHIPYRNSKLTHMLQNSLGGNSKTLMFVNVSPKEDNFQESLCSLRFATKVNQCNIGTAQKKVK